MSSLLEMLARQLGGGDTMRRIGQQLGTDEKTTGKATGAALSTLLGAIQRNASAGQGAESLRKALSRDHDGSLLDNLSGLLQNPQSGNGDGILKHVLGPQRNRVEAGLSQTTGLDSAAMGKLMTMLAPMVMGALGKAQHEKNMDASALSDFLGQERRSIEKKEPAAAGLMGKLLDQDGDGDVDLGDLMKGAGVLGKLFGR